MSIELLEPEEAVDDTHQPGTAEKLAEQARIAGVLLRAERRARIRRILLWLPRMFWWLASSVPYLRILSVTYPIFGILLVGYGAYLVYPPAGFIALGSLMILDTLHGQRPRSVPK